MSLITKPRSPYLWADITPAHGKRIRVSTGTSDREEAQKFHDELKAKLWSEPKIVTSWDKACEKWLQVRDRGAPEAYIIKKIGAIPRIHDRAFDHALIGMTDGTYNKYVGIIKAILNLSKIVIDLQKRDEPEGNIWWLTKEQWDWLLYNLPDHLKPIASFAVYTGLRESNVLSLKWEKVDLNARMVWVAAKELKGKKGRRKPLGIPLSDNALAVLKGITREGEYVFLYRGKPISKIKLAWQKACVRAGLGTFDQWVDDDGVKHRVYDGFVFHGLRHTWASWAVMNGTDLKIVKELGGWRTFALVERYAHIHPIHLKQFANASVPYSVPGSDRNPAITEQSVP